MKTLAVHLHLYYLEQLPEILQKLQNLSLIDYDLYVTMVQENAEVQKQILAFNPQTQIWVVENRGYDIGPFIDFLHHINLEDYKYVLKLHTKGKKSKNYTHLNGYRFNNALWGNIMWDSLIADNKTIANNIKKMNKQDIGMIGSQYCLISGKQNYINLLPQINEQLRTLNMAEVKKLLFLAGSMFMVKSFLLKPLLSYNIADFALSDGKIKDGTLAHVLERIFGVIVTQQGYQIVGVLGSMKLSIKLSSYWINFTRFFLQKKVTKSGKIIVKICKIPVYHKKIKEV